ncbi:P-loop containing nucleoside triphosphate hydrolase protein [Meira miltonrushii]|uniref:RNA helicase n=1 Tax=Meira miltonrushii TaxID=1280837 RepID=A0A316VL28_9BASI|nr:P-loop containing nucleoside triphosphate hydrolase protein [Meira miltonrushii]PWN37778.1 P-loop containing nucleoside triphosphate hydrolase protein [Meira miltonrushii]
MSSHRSERRGDYDRDYHRSSSSRYENDDYRRRKHHDDEYSRGITDSYSSSSRRRSRSPPLRDRYSTSRRDPDLAASSSRSNGGARHWKDDDRRDDRYDRNRHGNERDWRRDDQYRSERSGLRERSREQYDESRRREGASTSRSNSMAEGSTKDSKDITATTNEDKQKSKKEKLEAWRKERERKAAEEAKQKAAEQNNLSKPSDAGATTIKTSFKGFSTSNVTNSNQSNPLAKGKIQGTIAALDDTNDQAKQIQRFELPPMMDAEVTESKDEGDDEEELGLVDDQEVHGNREEIAATLKEKRLQATVHDEEKMQLDDNEAEEEEIDPLDAFMAGVTKEVKQVNDEDTRRMGKGKASQLAEVVGVKNDEAGGGKDDDDDEGDELDKAEAQDIMALAASKIKKREMATVDHSKVDYEPFRKAFYHPPAEVEEMSEEDAERLRMEMDAIKVRGKDCPKPLTKWSHCGLPGACLDVIKRLDYKSPTAIQAQAIPAIMSGRDIIGVAKTGSGKTMAFLLPMFRHIKDQRAVEPNEGPIGLIMTPTRELAVQIFRESKPFLKAIGLRAVCVYGGAPISEQIGEMKRTCEIVVATPGRMIDILMANSGRVTNLKRVTYLVLDEADRMFDMGFEPQVMKIVNNIRPDRQTVLFSATFPRQMESLARKVLRNKPLEITVGGRSVVAPEIEQIVEVREESTKFNRLLEILGKTYMNDEGHRTLIFVERQESADDLLKELMRKGYLVMSLHGGKDQVDRDSTIADFKAGIVPIVTATSVAARGLDVKQLTLVINYDVPNHMEDYVHRAGRTGRAGNKGTCITFITPSQDKYARDIIAALKASKVAIPEPLATLAEDFKSKLQSGKAHVASSGFGGKGLERFESDREKALAAQKRAFGENVDQDGSGEVDGNKATDPKRNENNTEEDEFQQMSNLQIEVKRGAAPDDVRENKHRTNQSTGGEGKSGQDKAKKDAEEAADNDLLARNAKMIEAVTAKGADASKLAAALAKIDAAARERKEQRAKDDSEQAKERQRKARDPDATDFHAIIPINDFPQRARWRVTNKETMSSLISNSGASITLKGAFYEKGKEPQEEEPPKLQLLIESNEEEKVEAAVREIKEILLQATQAALEAEQRAPPGAPGRYSVV